MRLTLKKNELELEYRGSYDIDDDSNTNGAWKQKFAIGYGVTDIWFTEFYAEFKKSGKNSSDAYLNSMEWENLLMLTNPGEHWIDLGVVTELKYNTSGGADKAELKVLLAKDIYKFTHLANIIFEHEFGEDSADGIDVGLSWGTRYRYPPSFEPGFEIYSNFGSLTSGQSYNEQDHRIGPVFYGKAGHFKYDVEALFGASDSAPDTTIKAIFEYEWYF